MAEFGCLRAGYVTGWLSKEDVAESLSLATRATSRGRPLAKSSQLFRDAKRTRCAGILIEIASVRRRALRICGEGGAAQLNANASKLEQSSTKPTTVTARKPPDTKSWLRMIQLPAEYFPDFGATH